MTKTIGLAGLALLKGDEGLRLATYDDATGRVAVPGVKVHGKLTIGYGHTGPEVVVGMEIDGLEAANLLLKDAETAEKAVNDLVKVPLTQNQFDALVCFTYNCGVGAFSRSTLLHKLNNGDFAGACLEFPKWNIANGKPMAGLTKRRADELALFNRPA